MTPNPVAEFAVQILREYAHQNSVLPRSTSDLSPLEEWLIIRMHTQQVSVELLRECWEAGEDYGYDQRAATEWGEYTKNLTFDQWLQQKGLNEQLTTEG